MQESPGEGLWAAEYGEAQESRADYGRRFQPPARSRLPASASQLLDETIAMIALDLDASVVDRSARAAALLQLGRQRLELGRAQGPAR